MGDNTERQRKFIISVVYWGIILGLVYLAYKHLLTVLLPFIIAYILAALLDKPITAIVNKTKLHRTLVSIISIVICASIGVGIISLISIGLYSLIERVANVVPSMVLTDGLPKLETSLESLSNLFKSIDPIAVDTVNKAIDNVVASLGSGVIKLGGLIITYIGNTLKVIPGILIGTIVTIVSSVFIASDFKRIHHVLTCKFSPRTKLIMGELKKFFGKTVPKCIASYVVIFLVTYLELSLGFLILDVKHGFMIALIIAALDILPVLGTGGALIPWAILGFMSNNIKIGIGMLVLYGVITVIRNIIEPKLVGNQIELHPILTFATMLVGAKFFGIVGLSLIHI